MARAAGTFRWTGAVDTVFSKGTNWVNSAGTAWDINQYPSYDGALTTNVDGDTIIFDAAVTNSPAGVDNSAKGDILSVKVTAAYNGTVGSAIAPLILDMQTTGSVGIDGSAMGSVYLKGGGTNGLQNIACYDCKSGSTIGLDGAVAGLIALRGTILIAATAVITGVMTVDYVTRKAGDVAMTITAGATLPAAIGCFGGVVTNNVAVTALNVSEGTWNQIAGDVASLETHGGIFNHTAGNITLAHIYDGFLDGSGSVTARTYTDVYLYKAGKLDVNNGADTIVITNLHLMTPDPKLTVVPGQVVDI